MNRILRTLLLAAATAAMLLALPVRADPPDRVGRISLLSGDVEFRNGYGGDGEDAVTNWPVTSGNVLATGRLARAEVRIGSTAVRLEEGTELEFAQLDDRSIKLRLMKGTVAVRVKNAERAADFELTTPQGRVLLLEPGRYRFESGVVGDTTSVAAFDGSARFEGANSALTVNSGQRLEAYGVDSQRLQTSAALQDEFDDWSLARDRRDQSARSLRFVSNEMTGYEDLDDYGDWRDSAEYGALWYPRDVPAGWAPYRWGRWAWVEPWGWTWVDDMPWGFAPFHYGRWALVGSTWAWVPGRVVARPAYAPALVAWVGRPGWNVSLNLGSVSAVGWFPLAPREVYYPAYPCSTAYVRNVNVTHVTNVVPLTDARQVDVSKVKYRYRSAPQAVTVVAADAVAHGRPVRRELVAVKDVRTLATLPVAVTAPAVKPVPRPLRARAGAPPSAAARRTPPGSGDGAAADDRRNGELRQRLQREAREQQMSRPEPRQALSGDHRAVTDRVRARDDARETKRDLREPTLKPGPPQAVPGDPRDVTDRARARDDARETRRQARERPTPKPEPPQAAPGDHRAAPDQAPRLDAARQAESVPGGDPRSRAPAPAAAQERRERGMHRDDARTPPPPAVRPIPTPRVDAEASRPKREGPQARQLDQRPRPAAAPAAPPPRPRVGAVPPRPAAAEKPQRGMDAAQAPARDRRREGQRGMSGMGGMQSAPAPDAAKRRESRGMRGRPEAGPGPDAPRM